MIRYDRVSIITNHTETKLTGFDHLSPASPKEEKKLTTIFILTITIAIINIGDSFD